MILRTKHDFIADERRRAERRIASAGRLVTRRTVAIENRVTPCDEIVQAPGLVRIVGRGGQLAFLFAGPFRVVLFRLHLDDDRHETMLLAAQLRALAPVDADLVGPKPQVPDESWNRILLDAECRHPP